VLALVCAAHAQTSGPPAAVRGGQGEIAFQGYYLGGAQQDLLNTTGTAIHFQEFLPSAGFLSGSIEGYGAGTRFQSGENFLELRGLPWAGRYWTFDAGDFRVPATLVEFPFNNVFNPEIEARGFEAQAVHGDTRYSFFAGQETLSGGARVVYRIPSPQIVIGASAVRRIAPHLFVAARAMQFAAGRSAILENPYLFPPGRTESVVRTFAVQSLYEPVKRLKMYAEASRPDAGSARALTSALAGVTWDSGVLTLKANYVREGILYFPLAGYFAGDRRGPYGEARLRPWKRLEFYGSASRYRNNLEGNPIVPSFESRNASAGASASLPGKVSVNGQVSEVRFTDEAPGEAPTLTNNRQITGSISRSIGRQTLQVNWREIRLDTSAGVERQRSTEAGDTWQHRHFAIGGAVRYQQVTGTEQLNSLFFRGTAQVNAGPLAAYANVEIGNDLANQTVFSTEAYRTSVVGATVRLPRRWSLQTEMFRNQLNFALNEENVFLMQGGALAGLSPAAANLEPFSQWSLFFRLSRQLRWGGGLPQENSTSAAVGPGVVLTGDIEGVVKLKTLNGAGAAASIPVRLDGARTVFSGADGHYVFGNVAEGAHLVALDLESLPADFDPGAASDSRIVVHPHRTARADFEVLPLGAVSGRITGPEGAAVDGIVVRIAPGGRYAISNKEGAFTFYNLREGDYELSVDPQSLPEGAELQGPVSAGAVLRSGASAPAVQFQFVVVNKQKPVRKVLDRK
jgi:hypothetical protein